MLNQTIAGMLLDIKAVSIVDEDNLFTWVSGIKSPIYCDNRLTISYPEVRSTIADGFADKIKAQYPDVDIIAGTATAGIPHAAWVADRMNKSMVYVRSTSKGHGKGNQIEGVVRPGDKVVLIEDLISTGGSSLKAVEALKEAGAQVVKVFGIFNYNFTKTEKRFEEAGVAFETLTDYKTLLPIAIERGYVPAKKKDTLLKWCENPEIFTK
ncbi:orotate phosphoribosyltransferase [Fusibacter sp. JL216-2]|uniref:orotate phosphoribosyltransferase n=1 Tax=Fusibacter sp. JL216-2 TaxID=3071453 RepID=UPI003D32FE77